MAFIEQILLFFGSNTPMIAFLGAIVGGEETLLFLAILASQGHIPLFDLFIFFYIGIVFSDSLWFFIGRTKIFDYLIRRKFISNLYLSWGKMLNKVTGEHNFQKLLVTKFLYGFRLPTIMYLAREKMKITSFLIYMAIVNLIWVSIILTLGWFAGKGILLARGLSHNLTLVVISIGITMILFTLLITFISKVTKKWLLQKQKQQN